MSRTRRREGASSPIEKYIDFSGGTGEFSYWDKDKKENVTIKKLDVIVLDVKASITGWHEMGDEGTNISSNMISNVSKEELVVRANKNKHFNKSKTIYEGLYDRAKISDIGGKYTANILSLVDIDGKGNWEMANIQLTGYALKTWTDFTSEHSNNAYYDLIITMSKGDKKKKGSIRFHGIKFETEELTEELADLATEKDEKLQSYFDELAGKKSEPESGKSDSPSDDSDDADEDDDDDLPF